jgi:hypothetical protein
MNLVNQSPHPAIFEGKRLTGYFLYYTDKIQPR